MFSVEGYTALLADLQRHQYVFSVKWCDEIEKNTVLLRHDIDFDLDYAVQMARIEHSLDVRSTYFIMLSSNMYNPLSSINISRISEIIELGHKISLHFDPTVIGGLEAFKQEKEIFETAFSADVDIVSLHRPGKFLEQNDRRLSGVSHTYESKYFKNITYVSDSGGRNPKSMIDSFLMTKNNSPLHLLIHPIWWVSNFEAPVQSINTWRLRHAGFIDSEISKNCKVKFL